MSEAPLVVCVGIAVLDLVFRVEAMPRAAEKYRARDFASVGGGIAANAAVAIARLGGRAALATRLGDDAIGAEIVAGLEAEGVDCALARRIEGRRSPLSSIYVDGEGERQIVAFADPEMPIDPSWLPERLAEGTRGVLGDTRWSAGAIRLFRAAREAGVPSVLDADRRPDDPDLLALATHAVFGQQGLAETTGIDDPRAALAALAQRHDGFLAVTLGAEGVLYTGEGGAIVHAPAPRVAVVDTLGAGDVWHGAFALALAERMDEARAVAFASAAAALKCTAFGGRAGAPTREALEIFMRERS